MHFLTEANNPLSLLESSFKRPVLSNILNAAGWRSNAETTVPLSHFGSRVSGLLGYSGAAWKVASPAQHPPSITLQLLATALVVTPVPGKGKGWKDTWWKCGSLAFLGLRMANSGLVQASQSSPKTFPTYLQS